MFTLYEKEKEREREKKRNAAVGRYQLRKGLFVLFLKTAIAWEITRSVFRHYFCNSDEPLRLPLTNNT